MKIVDFTELTLVDQIELLYNEGVFLGKRKQGFNSVILYQFEKLYVEIFYIRHRSEVNYILCSETTDILYPYLAQIDVEELLKNI